MCAVAIVNGLLCAAADFANFLGKPLECLVFFGLPSWR
jgi:hypothetical protein